MTFLWFQMDVMMYGIEFKLQCILFAGHLEGFNMYLTYAPLDDVPKTLPDYTDKGSVAARIKKSPVLYNRTTARL